MKRIITYSLTENKENSGNFYFDLAFFTENILNEAYVLMGKNVDDYYHFLTQSQTEKLRSRDEYVFEMILLGVLWRNYILQAKRTRLLSIIFLRNLYLLRKNNRFIKPAIDKIRGIFAYRLLNHRNTSGKSEFSLVSFRKLLDWLSATGEFNEENIRLTTWGEYFKTKKTDETESILANAYNFSDQFEKTGRKILGKYTKEVSNFQHQFLKIYAHREDYFFTARKENEYFLNMFGAEIMNRHMKEEFNRTAGKAVLLPTCMRNQPLKGCRAISDGKELVCMQCNPECNIGKIAEKMKKQNITPYLIPHSSDFSRFLVKWKDDHDTGLIGVACVLNLLTGGYEMKRLNIPSQCVFLDYCGCRKHWDKEGFPTTLNIKRLEEIISSAIDPIPDNKPVSHVAKQQSEPHKEWCPFVRQFR